MISFRQLRYFKAVADERHFGRAAEACHISQPALSMQIKELEQQLGVQLVERHQKGVRLTAEGRETARRAARILLEVQDLEDFAANPAGPLGRSLSLGAIPTIAPYFLPVVLPEIQAQYPDLQLTLQETQTDKLIGELAEGQLDVALLALPAGDNRFRSRAIFEDKFLLAMPARSQAPDYVKASDLKSDSLILLEEGHCLRDQALAVCGTVTSGAMNQFGATSLATILQMVSSGYGSTLVPEMAVPVEIRSDAPLALRHLVPEPSRTVGLIWRANAPRQERFRHLGDLLGEIWSDHCRSSRQGARPESA